MKKREETFFFSKRKLKKKNNPLPYCYFAYCRKSTDEKERQVLSIEAQVEELKEFAAKENLKIIEFLIESKTAKIPGRKVFNQMLDRIKQGEANGILSWHADRLARNSIDGGRIIYLIDTGKIKDLKFPTFAFEPTPQGKFTLSIAFSQSKYYVDSLSENVKRGNRQKLRRGEWPNKAPIGYLNEPRKRIIVLDSQKAPFVRKAFELYAKGNIGLKELSRKMYSWGIKTKAKKPLHLDSVKRMLKNPFYFGLMKFAGEFYEGSHQPIISKKLFDKVQEVFKAKTYTLRKRKHQFPFISFARCGECGCAITAQIQRSHHYYHCTFKKGKCSQRKYTREELLAKQVREYVRKVSVADYWKDKFLHRLEKEAKWDKEREKGILKKLNLKLKVIEEKLDRLLEAYLQGILQTEGYQKKQQELMEQKIEIKTQIKYFQARTDFWFEQMRDFILECNKARKLYQEEDLFALANFAKNIGSNITLKDKRLEIALKNPFRLVAEGDQPPNQWVTQDSNL